MDKVQWRGAGTHGCQVVVTGRREAVLREAESALQAEGITALGLQGDVRSTDDCEQWVQQVKGAFGRLNVLVNCAAGVPTHCLRLPHALLMSSSVVESTADSTMARELAARPDHVMAHAASMQATS